MSGKLMSDKFRALSFTAKIQYIWEFYKLRITIVVLSIALGTAIIHGVATNNRKPLYCAVFNDLNNEKIEDRVKEKYSEYTGCKKNVLKWTRDMVLKCQMNTVTTALMQAHPLDL